MTKSGNVTNLTKKEYFAIRSMLRKKHKQNYEKELGDYTYSGEHDVVDILEEDNFYGDTQPIPQNRGVLREDPITCKFRVYKSNNVYLRSAYSKLHYAFYKKYCQDNKLEPMKWVHYLNLIKDIWANLDDDERELVVKNKVNTIDWENVLKNYSVPETVQ